MELWENLWINKFFCTLLVDLLWKKALRKILRNFVKSLTFHEKLKNYYEKFKNFYEKFKNFYEKFKNFYEKFKNFYENLKSFHEKFKNLHKNSKLSRNFMIKLYQNLLNLPGRTSFSLLTNGFFRKDSIWTAISNLSMSMLDSSEMMKRGSLTEGKG